MFNIPVAIPVVIPVAIPVVVGYPIVVDNNNEILNLNVYQKIDLHGMPYSIEKIEELLDNEPNFNINYLDKNGKSLLDKVINLASNNKIVMKVFNRIINNQNISNNTLLNSLQHINEYIVRLPKNVTRPKLKVLLESKLR
jgi:hypothetical protein